MDREFYNSTDDTSIKPIVISRDRLYFRLKNDRTIQLCNQVKKRPLIEWGRKEMMVREKSRNLFETGKETVPDSLDEAKNFLIQQEEMLNIDGKDDDDDDDDNMYRIYIHYLSCW